MSKNPYELNAPAPKPVSTSKPSGGAGIGTAILAVVGSLSALLAVMYFAHCGGAPIESVARCDDRDSGSRYAWLAAPRDGDPAPRDQGLRISDSCARVLRQRMPECDADYLHRVNDDAPVLQRALHAGFTTFECEAPGGKVTSTSIGEFLYHPPR